MEHVLILVNVVGWKRHEAGFLYDRDYGDGYYARIQKTLGHGGMKFYYWYIYDLRQPLTADLGPVGRGREGDVPSAQQAANLAHEKLRFLPPR